MTGQISTLYRGIIRLDHLLGQVAHSGQLLAFGVVEVVVRIYSTVHILTYSKIKICKDIHFAATYHLPQR